MPYQPTVSEETELDGLPRRLPDQNAILIGRVVGDSEYSGLAVYYMHGRGSILLGGYANQEFVPEYTVKCENRLMSANVRAFRKTELETELSSIGKALLQAWHLGDLTPLSHKQSHVYALREKGGFSRNETAEILNISANTVDTHLQRAIQKLDEAKTLVRFEQVDPDELAEADIEFIEENATEHAPHGLNDITPLS